MLLGLLLVAGCLGGPDPGAEGSTTTTPSASTGELRLEVLAGGLSAPLYALPIPGRDGAIAIVEQDGLVRVLDDGELASGAFLDITDRTQGVGEQGLLGLAFHPQFASNGVAVVSYTDDAGDTVLSRMRLTSDRTRLDPGTEEILLTVDQPFSNHNGGHVLYGPDGYVYFGLGDGGSADDPAGHGQNKATLLGSMLRIDVGPTGPYGVPPDNPFVGEQGTPPETWSYGWRNPWRFHFDALTGDLWVGDVGQNVYEEVDFEPAGAGGRNYGWSLYEGNHHNSQGLAPVTAPLPGFTFPVAEYTHDEGCSITMGPVYRGVRLASLAGSVLYGDFCSGTIWSLPGPTATPSVLLQTQLTISSFGVDADGEVLVLDHAGGQLLRLVA